MSDNDFPCIPQDTSGQSHKQQRTTRPCFVTLPVFWRDAMPTCDGILIFLPVTVVVGKS